jgi:hypothetical protein
MKSPLNAAVALALCAFWLAGNAGAQTEPGATPAPGAATQPFPGIMVTPPRAIVTPPRVPPPAETQQSCPDTGSKLDLIV